MGSKGVGFTIESYGKVEISYINADIFKMDNDSHKIWHSDRSPLEEQFCVFKIFKMSAKTRHKNGG